MEREMNFEYEKKQITIQEQEERENTAQDGKREMDITDVIYIFTSTDKPGIKFYDRTPRRMETELTGTLPEGKYLTDMDSISVATWDEETNKANTTILCKVKDGTLNIKTIMVSEEQFIDIVNEIMKQKDNKVIVIDTRNKKIENNIDTIINNFDNKTDYKEFANENLNIINNIYDNFDDNKSDYFDNTTGTNFKK